MQQCGAAAASLGGVVRPRVRDEMLQGAEQKRAEPTLLTIGARASPRLDQVRKEPLRQILGIMRAVTLSPQEKEDRPPINPAQLRERAERLLRRCLRFARLEDNRPAGRSKRRLARFGGSTGSRHGADVNESELHRQADSLL